MFQTIISIVVIASPVFNSSPVVHHTKHDSMPCTDTGPSSLIDSDEFSKLGWELSSLSEEMKSERMYPGYHFAKGRKAGPDVSLDVEPFKYELTADPRDEKEQLTPSFSMQYDSYRTSTPFREMRWMPTIDDEMKKQELERQRIEQKEKDKKFVFHSVVDHVR